MVCGPCIVFVLCVACLDIPTSKCRQLQRFLVLSDKVLSQSRRYFGCDAHTRVLLNYCSTRITGEGYFTSTVCQMPLSIHTFFFRTPIATLTLSSNRIRGGRCQEARGVNGFSPGSVCIGGAIVHVARTGELPGLSIPQRSECDDLGGN